MGRTSAKALFGISLALIAIVASPAGACAQTFVTADGANRLTIQATPAADKIDVWPGVTNEGRVLVSAGTSGDISWGERCRNVRVEERDGSGYSWQVSCPSTASIVADLGSGDDRVAFAEGVSQQAEVYGGAGQDLLYGTNQDDRLIGGAGPDTIWGFGGVNTIKGGDLNSNNTDRDDADMIYGGPNTDLIGGDRGDDAIDGGAGNDRINGDSGGDTLIGGRGRDTVIGGGEVDHIYVRDGEKDIFYCGSTGASLPDGSLESLSDGVDNYFQSDPEIDTPPIDFASFFDCSEPIP